MTHQRDDSPKRPSILPWLALICYTLSVVSIGFAFHSAYTDNGKATAIYIAESMFYLVAAIIATLRAKP